MTTIKPLRTACYAIFVSLLLLVSMAPLAAADDCHELDCTPKLEVTGVQIPAAWNPLGDGDEVYSGWTVVDVVFPEGCNCQIEHVDIRYRVVQDFYPQDYSSGIEWRQIDEDTWEVHALDFDLYEVYFTVFWYCENGQSGSTTTTWLQRN